MLKLTPELTERIKKVKQMNTEEKIEHENNIIKAIRDKGNKNYSKMLDSLSDDQLRQMFKVSLTMIKTD
ncbi:DUF7366 family protein [Staphylococcus caeli]|uniref:DUF7366 family protein n=1 Tax=Staphylococcus caeli TaxID=2201815 RepID=UPI003F56BCEC